MTQKERLQYMSEYLAKEGNYRYSLPQEEAELWRYVRAFMNVRPPRPIADEFLAVQDAYLQQNLRERGVTDAENLFTDDKDLALWQGDITTLACDAIVNAANSQMLGCFVPGHHCIDNAIHTFAGVQLRLACYDIVKREGEEQTGDAKRTEGYNLPCKYVLHTVGPIVASGRPTKRQEEQLASCYTRCLQLADEKQLRNVAFCCISTGEFRFPNGQAAEIALAAVKRYKKETGSKIKVIFNVFKDIDYEIYAKLL